MLYIPDELFVANMLPVVRLSLFSSVRRELLVCARWKKT